MTETVQQSAEQTQALQRAIGEAVRSEMSTIAQTVTEQVSGTIGEKVRNEIAPQLTEIRTKLAGLEGRGDIKPDHPIVVELEKKLTDAMESIRLVNVAIQSATAKPSVTGPNFRGMFLKDREKIREVMRSLRGEITMETRALDSQLFTTGGQAPPDVADAFIDFVINEQVGLGRCQVRRMMSNVGYVDELTLSTRKLREASEGIEPQVANGIGTRRRTLTTKEVIWAEDITLTFLEDNIERANAEQHIARLLAQGFGNDSEDLAWNGNEAETADVFLGINDGWFQIATADALVHDVNLLDSVYESDSSTLASQVLAFTHQNLPYKYKAFTDLGYWVNIKFAEEYANEVSARLTQLGDQVLIGGFPNLRYFGRPIYGQPHLSSVAPNNDRIMLTPTRNLFFGIQRQMTIDAEWRPRKRAVEYTITARTDYEFATADAIVLTDGLPAQLRAL